MGATPNGRMHGFKCQLRLIVAPIILSIYQVLLQCDPRRINIKSVKENNVFSCVRWTGDLAISRKYWLIIPIMNCAPSGVIPIELWPEHIVDKDKSAMTVEGACL